MSPLIEVYGKLDCTDTQRSRALLDGLGVAYVFHDVESEDALLRGAQRLSGGTAVPVVVLPGGTILVEPSDEELTAALAE
jgi:mycoredoxin